MENLAPQDRVVLVVEVGVGDGATAAFDTETEAERRASVFTGQSFAVGWIL